MEACDCVFVCTLWLCFCLFPVIVFLSLTCDCIFVCICILVLWCNDDGICKISSLVFCFLFDSPVFGILNYILQATSKLQRCPDVAFITRSKEYHSTAGLELFHTQARSCFTLRLGVLSHVKSTTQLQARSCSTLRLGAVSQTMSTTQLQARSCFTLRLGVISHSG